MATYVTLFNWTSRGAMASKDTVDRVQMASAAFEEKGIKLVSIFWTLGDYDLVGIIEAPDDQTVAAALLGLASGGNIRTKTMRAFNQDEMQNILGNM